MPPDQEETPSRDRDTTASVRPKDALDPDVEKPPGTLRFPDAPRLELDQLLEQLRDLADDVLATQGRLRGLLRANATVAADLSLQVVLRRIVEAARELLSARYAALGVIGHDGQLEQFVHTGMDKDLVEQIGALPRGRGILGLLTKHPAPKLRVIYVWGAELVFSAGSIPDHGDLEVRRSEAARLLESTVHPWRDKFPSLDILEAVHHGPVVRTLTTESKSARALVLGGHRAGPLGTLAVGRTTNGVLRHASCPVIVMPAV